MATTPNFPLTARGAVVDVTTANTAVDGTGTLATLMAAASTGTRVDSIQIKAKVAAGATQAADTVRIFIYDGATARLFREQIVPAGTGPVSVTVANFETTLTMGIVLPATWQIRCSTAVGGTTGIYVLTGFGWDY